MSCANGRSVPGEPCFFCVCCGHTVSLFLSSVTAGCVCTAPRGLFCFLFLFDVLGDGGVVVLSSAEPSVTRTTLPSQMKKSNIEKSKKGEKEKEASKEKLILSKEKLQEIMQQLRHPKKYQILRPK